MAALPATNGFTRSDLIFRTAIWFEKRLGMVRERGADWVHLRKDTPFRVFDPCKGMRQIVNWQPVVVDS